MSGRRNRRRRNRRGNRRRGGNAGSRDNRAVQGGGSYALSVIPTYRPGFVLERKIRYQNQTTGGQQIVYGAGLLDGMFMATTATAGGRVFTAVRVKSIELWCSGAQSTTSATGLVQPSCQIEWVNEQYDLDSMVQANTLGSGVAHLRAVPKRMQSSGWWINAGGTQDSYTTPGQIAIINCGIGTIIDLVAEYIMIDDESAISVARTVAGATAKRFYYSSLDVGSGSSGILVPQGVNAI